MIELIAASIQLFAFVFVMTNLHGRKRGMGRLNRTSAGQEEQGGGAALRSRSQSLAHPTILPGLRPALRVRSMVDGSL